MESTHNLPTHLHWPAQLACLGGPNSAVLVILEHSVVLRHGGCGGLLHSRLLLLLVRQVVEQQLLRLAVALRYEVQQSVSH